MLCKTLTLLQIKIYTIFPDLFQTSTAVKRQNFAKKEMYFKDKFLIERPVHNRYPDDLLSFLLKRFYVFENREILTCRRHLVKAFWIGCEAFEK